MAFVGTFAKTETVVVVPPLSDSGVDIFNGDIVVAFAMIEEFPAGDDGFKEKFEAEVSDAFFMMCGLVIFVPLIGESIATFSK